MTIEISKTDDSLTNSHETDQMSNKEIIDYLFGSDDKIPVHDTQSLELPNDFWQSIKTAIDHYYDFYYPINVFNALEFDFGRISDFCEDEKPSLQRHLQQFFNNYLDEKDISYLMSHPDQIYGLHEFNNSFMDYLNNNGYRVYVDVIKRREQQKFSQFKRDFVRSRYYEWDRQLSDDFFKNHSEFIKYPKPMMIDRFALQVYADEFMTWKPDVKGKVDKKRYDTECKFEPYLYLLNRLQDEGYTDEEISNYKKELPAALDDEFDYMKSRSLSAHFKLTKKPQRKFYQQMWHEEGITYAFRDNPPAGAPYSLIIDANIQRRVYWKLKQDYPEIEEDYNQEFLEESNFIPLGWENAYLEYEQEVIKELKEIAGQTYKMKLYQMGFSWEEVQNANLSFNLHQCELCWNNELPLDTINQMHSRALNYQSYGLNDCRLDYNTPLFVTTYYSDVEPNFKRFQHKIYRKTKKNLRHEIILGKELKQSGDFGNGSFPLSIQFFEDIVGFKKYMFSKFIFNHIRRTIGFTEDKFQHGYYQWYNCDTDFTDEDMRRVLTTWLNSVDIPDKLKDLDLFDNLVHELTTTGYITRRFFFNFSKKEFEYNVVNSIYFERRSRGKYRVKRKSYLKTIINDYLRVKKQLGDGVNKEVPEFNQGVFYE